MGELVKVNRKAGEGLVAAATKSAREDAAKEVVEEIKRLLFEKEKALDYAERNKRAANFLQCKIDAIEKGQFSLQSGWQGTRIIFNDPDLHLSLEKAQEREW